MNVKAGDLAYVVKSGDIHKDCIGHIVNIISAYSETSWVIEFIGPIPASMDKVKSILTSRDDCLRRINGPAEKDDTKDEIITKEYVTVY